MPNPPTTADTNANPSMTEFTCKPQRIVPTGSTLISRCHLLACLRNVWQDQHPASIPHIIPTGILLISNPARNVRYIPILGSLRHANQGRLAGTDTAILPGAKVLTTRVRAVRPFRRSSSSTSMDASVSAMRARVDASRRSWSSICTPGFMMRHTLAWRNGQSIFSSRLLARALHKDVREAYLAR